MALHPSLLALSEVALHCDSRAAARGIVAESQQMLRNAVEHREDEEALAAWFSRLVCDLVRCPAVDSQVRLTGAVATGDALPTSPIRWLGEDPELAQFLTEVGLYGDPVALTPEYAADAGLVSAHAPGLEIALNQRPPHMQMVYGLPDRAAVVDIQGHLLSPIRAIARWAAPAPRQVADRLAIGRERELLTAAEADALSQAWATGLALELRNWHTHVTSADLCWDDLTALDRTAYGAASRMVAQVCDSLGARHG
ncbi:hypothetical protein [Corynebacterium lizhenjunii]|uniref:hypothetical protein n=1 Tax=Corynebacterium lizhenjunii TaxID=2709394 RepID=UPI0013EA4E60|nr:hypothetical protein [Corynebacterium lizhenjunii]